MALPNLGKLSLGPAPQPTAAEVPCRHFERKVSPEQELELAFKRFQAVQELREKIERGEVKVVKLGKRRSNRGILSNLDTAVETDQDVDMATATSLALGYQRSVGDGWSKAFDDRVKCPEPWTTPGPASIIRMRNYNWCYPEDEETLDEDRAQSYMLKAVLFLDLVRQRRQKPYARYPRDYVNLITQQPFMGSDTEGILINFLAECSTYSFQMTKMVEQTYNVPFYNLLPGADENYDDPFPPVRGTNLPDSDDDASDEDAPDDDAGEDMDVTEVNPVAGYTGNEIDIFDSYYERRIGYRMPVIGIRDSVAYRNELQELAGAADMFWNAPWEKRLGMLGMGRIAPTIDELEFGGTGAVTGEAYTFWDMKEWSAIRGHLIGLDPDVVGAWSFLREVDDNDNTGYTLGERSFKGPNTMMYPALHPNRAAYARTSHANFDSANLDNMPSGANVHDCLDIAVHVPIAARVRMRDREYGDESCKIDNESLATPGDGRYAIVVVRPTSYKSDDLGDNEPLSTDVYTGYPDNQPEERRPNIFLEWLQQNELRTWGAPRTSDGEVDRTLGWYHDFRDSYQFKTWTPNTSVLGIFGGSGGSWTNTRAAKKVPGANMRDVMVTDSDFYNAEVGEMLPSTLSDLPKVHKVPQGLVFFVDVTNVADGDQEDPCKYVDHIMNQCLQRGHDGRDAGCIAWLLDEMGKTEGYEAMANAKVLWADTRWATQSTHTETTMTPYERQTGFKLSQYVPGYVFLDPEDGPSHSGGVASHRFTAGCRMAFGLREADYNALHGYTAVQRRAGVLAARDQLRADWSVARHGVVDI